MSNPHSQGQAEGARVLPTRIVGIDFGISDEKKIIATPMKTLLAERKAEATVLKVAQELSRHAEENKYAIEEIIVGLPLLMSGKKGLLADEVAHFVGLLKEQFTIPIITWDERLTSVQADRSLREGNMSRKKRSSNVDSVAAIIILQSYLDGRSFRFFNQEMEKS